MRLFHWSFLITLPYKIVPVIVKMLTVIRRRRFPCYVFQVMLDSVTVQYSVKVAVEDFALRGVGVLPTV